MVKLLKFWCGSLDVVEILGWNLRCGKDFWVFGVGPLMW